MIRGNNTYIEPDQMSIQITETINQLPVNFDVGTASPINRAILPLLDKAQAGEDTNRLGQKPGKDVL